MTDLSKGAAPPRALTLAVALVAAAMLLAELMATRLFSVLFYYHFSFFAVSLVMAGLALGGIAAARWDVRGMDDAAFARKLSGLAGLFAGGLLGATLAFVSYGQAEILATPTLTDAAVRGLCFLPALTAAGAFLAAAFARREGWIGRLYAADLAAAAAACLGAIGLMRVLQGPVMLLAPALMAAAACWVLAPRGLGRIGLALCALIVALLVGNEVREGRLIRLRVGGGPVAERWNEHSRVLSFNNDKLFKEGRTGFKFVIDKSAATYLVKIPKRDGGPAPVQPWWDVGISNLAYRLGRPLDKTAVIGVGGGRDILAAVGAGAKHVDGYELNALLLGWLRGPFSRENDVAFWPEVNLIHSEARVGIRQSAGNYDVIQASLIDTWAATASGGFALSENGLYTVEGWRTFLDALSDRGVLTMTRWFLRETPAETQRLVALAAEALRGAGYEDATSHIMLAVFDIAPPDRFDDVTGSGLRATIMVSKTPFTPEEVERVRAMCAGEYLRLYAAPGIPPPDPTMRALLVSSTRQAAIDASPFDIAPPTDLRPYFFMQMRPRDLFKVSRMESNLITDVTMKGLLIMRTLVGLSIALTLAVFWLSVKALPAPEAGPGEQAVYARMAGYFLFIGLGYVMIQLALHQRLILVLGHPIYALSVALFSMLLGTGIGAALSDRLFPAGRMAAAWVVILIVVAGLNLGLPFFAWLDHSGSMAVRVAGGGGVAGIAGLALGFAFPIGVRIVAPTGAWAVQRMWAINGAASVAGSSAAALLGLALGTRGVLAAGLACYLGAAACGALALRAAKRVTA